MFGATELAVLVKSYWSEKFFDTLRNNLVHIESVDNSYQGDMQAMGDTVKIATFPDFSEAELLPSGGSGQDNSVTVTSQSLTANKRPYCDVTIDDMARLQSMDFSMKLLDAMTFSIMKRANREVLNAMVPSASAPDHQISYVTTSTLTFADFIAVSKLLQAQDVPMSDRFVVVGATAYCDMFNIGEFTSRDYNGGESVISNGTFGKPFMGFTPRFTNMVGTTTQFFHKSCVTVAFQKGLNTKIADGGWDGARAQRINMDTIMGVKLLDSKRVVRVD